MLIGNTMLTLCRERRYINNLASAKCLILIPISYHVSSVGMEGANEKESTHKPNSVSI